MAFAFSWNFISAALDAFGRTRWDADPHTERPPLAECAHACIPCKLAFHTRQQWGAHAHRVHSYHSRAHRIAKGRTCGACGLQVASPGRLRTHLRLSPACFAGMEQALSEGTFSADMTEAHDLAPAVPGVGKKALGPAPPEMLPELTAELDALVPADADAIFDVVSRCIAPLPVLRCTIETWCRTLPPGVLRSAAEDVLLVFSPEHLCTRISGRKACSSPASPDFVPLPDLPVIVCGPLVSHWVEGVNAGHLAVTTIAFSDVAAWSWRQAAPPASPSLGPLLGLRRCSLLLPAACEFCANCQSGSTASSLRLARSCSWPRQDGRFGFVSLSRRRLWNRYPTGLLPWPKSWHLAPSLRQSGDNIGDNSLQ